MCGPTLDLRLPQNYLLACSGAAEEDERGQPDESKSAQSLEEGGTRQANLLKGRKRPAGDTQSTKEAAEERLNGHEHTCSQYQYRPACLPAPHTARKLSPTHKGSACIE